MYGIDPADESEVKALVEMLNALDVSGVLNDQQEAVAEQIVESMWSQLSIDPDVMDQSVAALVNRLEQKYDPSLDALECACCGAERDITSVELQDDAALALEYGSMVVSAHCHSCDEWFSVDVVATSSRE